MLEFFWNLCSFIIALGILVTVHEYGHFWVARRNGVKVERFSVGFGQTLFRKTDKQGTEFVIALIPLGGYVKMLDERVDDVAEEDKQFAFNNKTVYQKIAIIAAGPIANFIFAIFAFYLMFLIGVPSVKPIIGKIEEGSIASQSAIKLNSEIVKIADKEVFDWQDISMVLVGEIGADTISITVKNSVTNEINTVKLDTSHWSFLPEKESAMASLGIVPFRPAVKTTIALVGADSPAEKAGLIIGDKIIAINGKLINDDWFKLSEAIKEYPGESVAVLILRNGKEQVIDVFPEEIIVAGKAVGYFGISPEVSPWPSDYLIDIRYGVFTAVGQSFNKTWDLITISFSMIGKLITGDVSVKNLSGPISIAQGAGNSANHGIAYFLSFLALISINLGIINLLPLPVLDGGHLFYYMIEVITGKPVPENIQEKGFKFGALALLTLMSIAIFNDISRL